MMDEKRLNELEIDARAISEQKFRLQAFDIIRLARIGLLAEKTLVPALKKINAHGCCVMHNDSSCPGCTANDALAEYERLKEGK